MSDYGERLDALEKAKYPDLSDDMDMHDITDGMSWMAARIEELENELHLMKTAGIIEVSVRNPSVMEYMKHWEGRAEAAEAKLAKAVGLLEAWINVAAHCTIEEGVCCCGDSMDTHAEPMDCGHSPFDHGAYIAKGLVEETNAILAELKAEE